MNIRAVFLLSLFLLLAACTAAPPDVAPPTPAVAPSATALPATPTTAPTPTPEPTATPTLTADQLRDQRATAVLTTLPGYDPARHDALLPLAHHLWGEEYVIDPADVAIVIGETAVRVNADATGSYPPGTLFLWHDDSQPLILTGQQDTTINRGEVAFGAATLDTWIRYDLDGNILEFVDPAGNWISPLDMQANGRFTFFTQEQIGPNGERQLSQSIWWANGGQPTEIANGPDGTPMANFLGTNPGLQLTEAQGDNGQHLVALADADGVLQFTLDEGGNWTIVEQSPLTVREYYSDVPFVFLADDFRGVARGEIPAGVNPDNLLTMAQLDELARTINFTPTRGCSTEYGPDGYHHTLAAIVGFGSAQIKFSHATVDYGIIWLQTCGVGPNGELVSVLFPAVFQGMRNEAGVITELDERSRVNFNTWSRATGEVDPALTLSPTYLDTNRDRIIGRAAILRLASNIPDDPVGLLFADLVNPRRNGLAGIDETSFNFNFPGGRPFRGTVALDKP